MKSKHTITTLIVAIAIAAIASFAFFRDVQKVAAFNPQPDPPKYGLVGITDGQTIRISIVNTNEANPAFPADPCRVMLNFTDADGNLIRNRDGEPIRRSAQLAAGQSTFLDLNGDLFAGGGRLQLRPVARIHQPDGRDRLPPDPCIPTVEVFGNANGKTQFILPAVTAARIPPPVAD